MTPKSRQSISEFTVRMFKKLNLLANPVSEVTAAMVGERAFRRMAPDVRRVFSLHYLSGVEIREIPELASLPEDKAIRKCHSALMKFVTFLSRWSNIRKMYLKKAARCDAPASSTVGIGYVNNCKRLLRKQLEANGREIYRRLVDSPGDMALLPRSSGLFSAG